MTGSFAWVHVKQQALFFDKLCWNIATFIITSFVEYSGSIGEPCRHCSICGKLFREGYCYNYGKAFYCSDECLHRDFTDDEYLTLPYRELCKVLLDKVMD